MYLRLSLSILVEFDLRESTTPHVQEVGGDVEFAILGDLQTVAELTPPSFVAPGSPALGASFFSCLSKYNFLTLRAPIQLSTGKESKDVQSLYIIVNNFDDYLIHGR
jgi:hypothetical protein